MPFKTGSNWLLAVLKMLSKDMNWNCNWFKPLINWNCSPVQLRSSPVLVSKTGSEITTWQARGRGDVSHSACLGDVTCAGQFSSVCGKNTMAYMVIRYLIRARCAWWWCSCWCRWMMDDVGLELVGASEILLAMVSMGWWMDEQALT